MLCACLAPCPEIRQNLLVRSTPFTYPFLFGSPNWNCWLTCRYLSGLNGNAESSGPLAFRGQQEESFTLSTDLFVWMWLSARSSWPERHLCRDGWVAVTSDYTLHSWILPIPVNQEEVCLKSAGEECILFSELSFAIWGNRQEAFWKRSLPIVFNGRRYPPLATSKSDMKNNSGMVGWLVPMNLVGLRMTGGVMEHPFGWWFDIWGPHTQDLLFHLVISW